MSRPSYEPLQRGGGNPISRWAVAMASLLALVPPSREASRGPPIPTSAASRTFSEGTGHLLRAEDLVVGQMVNFQRDLLLIAGLQITSQNLAAVVNGPCNGQRSPAAAVPDAGGAAVQPRSRRRGRPDAPQRRPGTHNVIGPVSSSDGNVGVGGSGRCPSRYDRPRTVASSSPIRRPAHATFDTENEAAAAALAVTKSPLLAASSSNVPDLDQARARRASRVTRIPAVVVRSDDGRSSPIRRHDGPRVADICPFSAMTRVSNQNTDIALRSAAKRRCASSTTSELWRRKRPFGTTAEHCREPGVPPRRIRGEAGDEWSYA